MPSNLRALCLALLIQTATYPLSAAGPKVDFDRDIRPILSDNCFACHGPDAAQVRGDLRIDQRDAVTKITDGTAAIVPGKPAKSEMIRRIFANDESELMPPPETRKKLTARQKQLIKQRVTEGAEYTKHWAFIAPKRPRLPAVKNAKWSKNAIDRFVLARLESKGIRPSKEASRETLVPSRIVKEVLA